MNLKAYNEDDFLLISGIQHFSFCRRQWALIHLEEKWGENRLTAEGRVIHARVHDSDISDIRNGILTCREMQIKSAVLGITGCCDAVEFVRTEEEGIMLHGRDGKWLPRPVEYKRGSAKIGDCDRLQLAAQAMCLEEMFCCPIPAAYLFYHETRRREKVAIGGELRAQVTEMFGEMHDMYQRGYTPKVKYHSGCRNCSLAEECLPSLGRGKKSAREYLDVILREEKDAETT